jgi:hypothetical protein
LGAPANLKTPASQQRNVVLHPEFVDGQCAFYTRPMDGFIDIGSGGDIGWTLCRDINTGVTGPETIIDSRAYHTIKEVKNSQGPAPIKTGQGWLHLAHGVRACAAGLRYVLYLFMTSLEDPTRVIARPDGHFLAPYGDKGFGDVSNVTFSNASRSSAPAGRSSAAGPGHRSLTPSPADGQPPSFGLHCGGRAIECSGEATPHEPSRFYWHRDRRRSVAFYCAQG